MNIQKVLLNDRLLKAVIGMSKKEFFELLLKFEPLAKKPKYKRNRKRKPGAGRKHTLKDASQKLFFILFYMKCYPTHDVAAFIFGVDRAQINRWVKSLRVILEKALGKAMVLPERQIKSVKEFVERFPEVKELIIDGTERPINRPKDKEKQKECYSGKKKRHTRKNIIGVSGEKEILFVSPSVGGREHDYPTLKESKLLESIPKDMETYCDLGFKGIEKAYSLKINIPIRKPKTRELTKEEREYNRRVNRYRVKVENTIAGVKRFRVITDVSRMRDEKMNDHMMWLCCGLWNFHLKVA